MSLKKNNVEPLSITHRAGWVLIDPENIIENGFVKTESGKIVDVGQGRGCGLSDKIIDHGSGVLMPGLVNAHTHLELSALKNKTNTNSGFIAWVQSVIEKRNEAGEKKLFSGIYDGISELAESGSLIAGEIASLGLSRQPFLNSKISGVWFREYLGVDTSASFECEKISEDKIVSVAGHAPHTTASDLLVQLKSVTDKSCLPFSLHLAESKEEVEFIATGKGQWADFLNDRKVDTSAIKLTGAGPVKYADQMGLLDANTLAVHLVFADNNDIRLLADRHVHVCICPRSNQVLHRHLPDVPLMVKSGLKLCLGTDSLASNDSLSIFDEMQFLSKSFSDISPTEIVSMATVNGVVALGFEKHFGRLTPGRRARMIYLPINEHTVNHILESIVAKDFSREIKTLY
ncbi:MAG: amidohydrolase family protein [Desulfobacteraceae bacterium]|nr:amidohydrolase family protein [Desulfobacteraceae bacterium]